LNARSLQPIVATVLLLCAGAGALADGFAGLGSDARGFAEVVPGKALVFPEDFGAHPDFRIEWWYLTANLKDDSGNSYGVQWTLFRQAMEPGPERQGWSNQQVWMGHAAVTSAAEHLFAETLARGGIGQAGVTAAPFRAWIDDWSFLSVDPSPEGGLSRANVSAKGSNFRYTLNLETSQPVVRHGEQGISRKSEGGQASYYYSQPFFTADGVLIIRGREVRVSGQAWMDREWSSRPLTSDQKGWDWFSLHFASGEKLMVFRLRSEEASAFNSGTWIASDGTAQPLGNSDIVLTPLSESTPNGRKIPTTWKIKVKSHDLDIETMPLNADSWMATSIPYWEGPVSVTGSRQGRGYLEMTGY
jgi:predicted secreted hydrolase